MPNKMISDKDSDMSPLSPSIDILGGEQMDEPTTVLFTNGED